MAQKRGWKDWVKGIALYGMAPDGDLILIRTDEQGNLTVSLIPHHTTHEAGGSDEIDVTNLKGVLYNLQKGKWSVYDARANFPSGQEVGELAYATDERKLYRWDGSAWEAVLSMGGWRYFGPKANFPTDVVEGDLAYATDEYTLYRWNGSAWEAVLTKDFNALVNKLHAAAHESGGDDEIDVTGLHGELADPQPPKAHASTHQPGGSDALPTGTPSAITEGATGSEGSSTSFARADHVHETPSQWTPKEHGNEAHNPDYLAVDGSNSMQGELKGGVNPCVLLRNIVIPFYPRPTSGVALLPLSNFLAFATKRGGTVAFSPTPAWGTAENLFDAKVGSVVCWTSPSGSIVVEITLPGGAKSLYAWGIVFREGKHATDFTVEYYHDDTGTWEQVGTISGNTDAEVVYFTGYKGTDISRIRFTFTGYHNADYFQIVQIFAWCGDESWKWYVLYRDGGDVYGDIDMNGNDILSPGLVDGVDVSAHAARHQAGGADELTVSKLAGIEWKGVEIYSGVPSEWQTLDLSSHVGSRRALVGIRITHPGTYTKDYLAVPADWTSYPATDFEYHVGPYAARIKGRGQGALITWTDSSGRIKVWTNSAESDDKWYLEWYIALT